MVIQGRAIEGFPHEDCLLQGRAWSCPDMALLLDLIRRLWQRWMIREALRGELTFFADDLGCSAEGHHRPIIILFQVCHRLTPLTGTELETDPTKLTILTSDGNVTAEEQADFAQVGVVLPDQVPTTAVQIGGITGYGWTVQQWWEIPLQRLEDARFRWQHSADPTSLQERCIIWKNRLSKRLTYVESCVPLEGKALQKTMEHRRKFLVLTGIASDELINDYGRSLGAPLMLEDELKRGKAARMRVWMGHEDKLRDVAEEAQLWDKEEDRLQSPPYRWWLNREEVVREHQLSHPSLVGHAR